MVKQYKRPYAAEFRQQMVELVATGRSPNELSKEFGCHATSILAWCRQANVRSRPEQQSLANKSPSSHSDSELTLKERQELVELRKKLKRVEMERDILAKATAWFASNND